MSEIAAPLSPEAILMRIPARLNQQVSIQSALDAVAEDIAQLIPFTHADICLFDTPAWVASYEVGISTYWSERRTRLDCSPVRDVLTGKLPFMLSENAMEDPRQTFSNACSDPIFRHGLRSRVHVPLYGMGSVLGTLNLSHDVAGRYAHATVTLAQRLASVLAPGFQALQLRASLQQMSRTRAETQAREEGLRRGSLELTQALEQERQRIGMDLHDQTLADLTRLLRELQGDGPPPASEWLAEQLEDCIDDLRGIIETTSPRLLDLFGFTHAIRVHLERAAERDRLQVDIIDETQGAPDQLPPTVRTALYRIVQEAINNAARHACAGRIWVNVRRNAQAALWLTVRDDGRGLGGGHPRACGIEHMRTRARLIAAELDIFDDAGTCVSMTLPPLPLEVRA
ncbi:GAF domain-containing sensor histidine kinase [Salinicola aestuarinus]|uniref:GAF domain-containing sensor histidine kinase n=1 Tax=Salinicola aestuarinus TaxID=1949082 RepID=UPI000DA261CD|nr:ATP-binding protein [Salinicola aestuarinus]